MMRNGNGKDTSFSVFALEGNRAVQQVGIPLYNVQAQACALYVARVGGAEEAFENMLLVGVGNADAFIAHMEGAAAGRERTRQVDGLALVAVLTGVGDEVEQDVSQNAAVAVYHRHQALLQF